jgi:DNA polymerase (family 10)
MKNQIVARILYEVADILEIKGVEFKPYAYRRAAQSIGSLTDDIEEYYKKGKLEEIPGVGKAIAEKVAEIIETGSLKHLEDLKKSMPVDLELLNIGGLGPKKVMILYKKLKIRNVNDLEKSAKAGKISKLHGFGEKTEKEILDNIELSRKRKERMLLGHALPIAEEIIRKLKKLGYVDNISVAGSLRRMKETIGDIDILVTSKKPEGVMKAFTGMEDVDEVLAKGTTKSSVLLKSGIQADIRVVEKKSFGSALLYFTGSKEHNIALRKIAIQKKMKLSEYGLFKGNTQIAGKTEEEVYKKLGLHYIEPEIRESAGEIEASLKNKLPKLIGYDDIKGDLQMHSNWSDGQNTIEEMASAAKRLGYEYICITDHTGSLAIAHGLDEKRIEKQYKEIDKAENKIDGIRILHGCEVNIRSDGSLDIRDNILKKLDIVVAGVHSGFKQDNTERIMKAMENENVDIIAHLTGRKMNERKEYDIDIHKIIDKAKETGTILEIDAQPKRLDLNDVNARAAIEHGCRIAINTDAHSIEQLSFMKLGIGTARRAWLENKHVINANNVEKMLKMLK